MMEKQRLQLKNQRRHMQKKAKQKKRELMATLKQEDVEIGSVAVVDAQEEIKTKGAQDPNQDGGGGGGDDQAVEKSRKRFCQHWKRSRCQNKRGRHKSKNHKFGAQQRVVCCPMVLMMK